MYPQKPPAHIILSDHPEQISELRIRLEEKGIPTEPYGLGYARGIQFSINKQNWIALHLSPANAAPFLYICISQLTNRFQVKSLLGTASALTLISSLSVGSICLVDSSISTPYPALFESIDPYSPPADALKITPALPNPHPAPPLFTGYPKVCAGSCRHPRNNGSLIPWNPAQWQQLSYQGIDIYSEFPAGIAQATAEHPGIYWQTLGICIGSASVYDQPEMTSFYSETMASLMLQWIDAAN